MTKAPKKKKSLLRRILKWTGITFLVLIILIIAAPFLFKDQIVQFVKDTANKELNAKVNFGEFELTLFSTFPDFTLSVNDVSVANVGEFEGDTLLFTKNLEVGLNLMSVISGDQYKINTITLTNPRIHALVLKDGKANWDITKPSADSAAPAEESTPFKMTLKKFEIKNGYIVYDDASLGFKSELVNMNHTLSGDFTADNFILKTLTDIEKFSMSYGGVSYMNKVKTNIKADLDANMTAMKFTFKENEFSLNELTLGMDGFVAMPKDDIDMDLKFKANQTEFKNILSLVPGVYTADFKDVKTSGSLSLDGFAKGIYNDKKMPAYGVNLQIKNAMFKYPSLPKSATNIQVDLKVDNKTGVDDATVIDLKKFHVDLGGNPVDATMYVSTLVSDANINAAMVAKINLATMKDVIPMEKGDDVNGQINADVKMKGRMSSIEKEKYEEFDAKGNMEVINMNYKTASLSYPTKINKMNLSFNPKTVDLTVFDAQVGKSDLKLDGKIENFLQYALKDSLLKGTFNLKSNLLDINQLMASDESTTTTATQADTSKMSVLEVPSNLDVNLKTSIGKMLYDNLTISKVLGSVTIKNSKMILDHLKFGIDELEGTMDLSGTYNTQNAKKPSVNFDADIANFDIAKTYKTFESVQKMAPIGKYAKGKFGTVMKYSVTLDQHMSPVMNTLNGYGKLTSRSVVVDGFEPINKLADALNQPKYKKMAFENLNISYEFKDGRVHVKETPIKSGPMAALVKGSTGFDQTIDYTWDIEIPRSEFGTQANAAAGSLLDQLNKKARTNVKMGDKVKVKAIFGGTAIKPTLKTQLFGSEESPKEQIKEVVGQVVDNAKEKARAEADKILRDAQAQADKIKADAAALSEKTRKEGYAAIDKNIESIKNPVAKATAKAAAPAAKKDVDKKAQAIVDEANKKADKIMADAKVESDKKLQ